MALLVVQPAAPLSALVESIWDCEAAPQAHRFDRMLPTARAQLVINLAQDETRVYDDALRCTRHAGAALDGPAHRSFVIDTDEQTAVLGVVFRAGAAAPFFRESMDALANRHVGLDALAAGEARRLRERLLDARDGRERLGIVERWLLAQSGRRAIHPAVSHALRIIDAAPGTRRIDAVAAQCRMPARRLGALFREHVGMSPKRYARLQRFHGVLAQARRGGRIDWAAVAADGGFHDQAHLVHEFRAFSGMTPTAWMARRGPWQLHVPLA